MKNYWKQFSYYDKAVAVFFIVNLFLDIINERFLNSLVSKELIGYLFWLSLGLFLGFQLCKYECKKLLKKHSRN
jgi:hypothetical protein